MNTDITVLHYVGVAFGLICVFPLAAMVLLAVCQSWGDGDKDHLVDGCFATIAVILLIAVFLSYYLVVGFDLPAR